MASFFGDTSCCGGLDQTNTFDEKLTELEPTISTGVSVKTPSEIMKDLLQLGINKKSNLEVYKGISVEKLGHNHKNGLNDYMADLALHRPNHILELLLAQQEEKPRVTPKDRSQIWRSTFEFMEENLMKANGSDADLRPAFSSFGNQDFQQMLKLLCQVNPFFASALTFSQEKNTLELIAHTKGEPSEADSLYLSLMRILSSNNPSCNINVYFDEDMKVQQLQIIDQNGKERFAEKGEMDYYASGALYNLLFYSTAIHANIDILHDIMSSGIIKSTRHSKTMSTWADHYDDFTTMKYVEVAALYMNAKVGKKEFGADSVADRILTGENGLGGNAEVMQILRQQLCEWMTLTDTNDYITKFLLQNFYNGIDAEEKVVATLDKFDILTEYRKHAALGKDFAEDLTTVMETEKFAAFEKTQQKLKAFMDKFTGGSDKCNIDNISSWIQLWNITNLTQESSSTYSRLSIIPEIMRWRKIDQKYWGKHDVTLMCTMVPTMIKTSPRRHFFTTQCEHDKEHSTDLLEGASTLLDTYERMTTTIKKEYYEEICASKNYIDFGWIHSSLFISNVNSSAS